MFRPSAASALGMLLVTASVGGGASWQPPRDVALVTARPPMHIARDCSEDVTHALNRWMRRVPNGSVLRLRRGACYRVDGTLRLVDRRHLRLAGNHAVLRSFRTPPIQPKITRQMLLVQGGSDIRIHHLTIRGTNPSAVFDVRREWHPLIEIAGGRDIRLDHISGRNSWGDFVLVGPDTRRVTSSDGTGAVLPRDVTVRSSNASVIGRHGIACIGCDDLAVDANSFRDIGYQVMDIEVEASTWHARGIAFTNNTVRGRIALSLVASGDAVGHDVTGVEVSGNRMLTSSATCAPPVEVLATSTSRSDFVVSGNQFKTLSNAARIGGVAGAVVTDNRVEVSDAGCSYPRVAVVARNVRHGVLRGNTFPGATTLLVGSGLSDFHACGNWLSVAMPALPQPCDAA
jgi:hypothetical protein